MTIRLNKVTRDLNVGITTAVEFLQKKGFTVEANPNTKITDEQFELLKKEFSTDKDLKIKSERFSQERQNYKERNKAAARTAAHENGTQEKEKPAEETKAVVPGDNLPKFKPIGKVDLESLKRPRQAIPVPQTPEAEPQPEPEPQPTPEPEPVEAPQPEPKIAEPAPEPEPQTEEQPVAKEPVVSKEEQPEAPAAEEKPQPAEEQPAKQEEEVFKIHHEGLGTKINIIGQIDLAALNQSTRPRKKSKEEKRREREEKEKQRQDQRKQMKEAIIKEIRRDDAKSGKDAKDGDSKKKRARINKEKVDINNVSNFPKSGGGDHSFERWKRQRSPRQRQEEQRPLQETCYQTGSERGRRGQAGEGNLGTPHRQRQEQSGQVPQGET